MLEALNDVVASFHQFSRIVKERHDMVDGSYKVWVLDLMLSFVRELLKQCVFDMIAAADSLCNYLAGVPWLQCFSLCKGKRGVGCAVYVTPCVDDVLLQFLYECRDRSSVEHCLNWPRPRGCELVVNTSKVHACELISGGAGRGKGARDGGAKNRRRSEAERSS